MNKSKKEYVEIDILEILKAIWNYKFIVVLFVAAAVLIAGVQTVFFTPDTYTADGIIYVESRSSERTEQAQNVTKNDIDAARTLSATYIEALKTRTFLSEISSRVGDKYSWNEIKNMITIEAMNETELLSVKVVAASAEDAYYLAYSTLELAPEILTKVAKGGNIEVLDEVQVPTAPNDKGLAKKMVIAGLIGAILAILLIFLLTFFDTKIRKGEDIENRYNFPILGVIEN